MREIDKEGGRRAGDSWGWVYCTPFKPSIKLGPRRMKNLSLRNIFTVTHGNSSNTVDLSRQ
jgi:hypothetical protein